MLQDILFPDLRMSGMGSVEDRIKSPHQRIMGSGHPVLENAEHLLIQQVLVDSVIVVKRCLRPPADKHIAVNMRLAELKNLA